MHWLNLFLQVNTPAITQATSSQASGGSQQPTGFWSGVLALAPIFSSLAALSNLGLAILVYRYTRRKNLGDTRVKWFLEFVYTPNKQDLWQFFDNLHKIQVKIPTNGNWTNADRIAITDLIKAEEKNLRKAFLEVLELVEPSVYKEIDVAIVKLTDDLTNAVGNDENKLEHPKTYERLIYSPINKTKGKVVQSLYKYTG